MRSAPRSSVARLLVLFFVAALCPAFVSAVEVVDIARAGALPVAAALLASVGFVALYGQLATRRSHVRRAVAAAALAICFGGTLLFDVINPRILPASSLGIMFQVLPEELADRVVVLTYAQNVVRDAAPLPSGPITAFGGPRPVGYFEWDGAELPAADLTAAGKTLFFWSHGFDQDLRPEDAICRQWPDAAFFEIRDQAALGRVHGALVGSPPWWPRVADARWSSWRCGGWNARSRTSPHA